MVLFLWALSCKHKSLATGKLCGLSVRAQLTVSARLTPSWPPAPRPGSARLGSTRPPPARSAPCAPAASALPRGGVPGAAPEPGPAPGGAGELQAAGSREGERRTRYSGRAGSARQGAGSAGLRRARRGTCGRAGGRPFPRAGHRSAPPRRPGHLLIIFLRGQGIDPSIPHARPEPPFPSRAGGGWGRSGGRGAAAAGAERRSGSVRTSTAPSLVRRSVPSSGPGRDGTGQDRTGPPGRVPPAPAAAAVPPGPGCTRRVPSRAGEIRSLRGCQARFSDRALWEYR
ncbi:uncharacterized protein LOC141730824 [Zonotrichia albicollis]|uniref:uncharacterized protein LOC141730824 n=1 Tax=Zonotrichia albicollis TaxID=44394 RepID=UPI003D8117E0